MEFKEGSLVYTKDGVFPLKKIMTLYNAFTLQPVTLFLIDNNGVERSIEEKDVIKVENNHTDIEEP